MYSCGPKGITHAISVRKADALDFAEGRRPANGLASLRVTTGVLGSGRKGLNLAGESPAISIARFGYVAIPRFV